MSVERTTRFVDNGVGWQLALHRYVDPARLRPDTRPVVMVPGFAMNSFILGYHPRGTGIAGFLAEQGHEVWAVDLRGQGMAQRSSGPRGFGMADVALVDLPAAIDAICHLTTARGDAVDLIGCSLGATYMFMYAAWLPGNRAARLVNLGGPLRWTAVHPLLRTLSAAPPLWSLMRMKGTRGVARHLLPLAARVPGLLHIYLHPAICDLSEPATLVQTVDDPVPAINREIARWVRAGDLLHRGRNLTDDVARLEMPLLTLVANADGIVPEATVCSAHNVMRRADRALIFAGDERRPMAHADLFISDPAEQQVFRPLAAWLAAEPAAHAAG